MLVNIHIPKNAGSTVNNIFKRNFGERYTIFQTDRCGEFLTNSELIDLIENIKPHTDILSGHDILPLDAKTSKSLGINYFTFIRHPISRAISLYYYEKARTKKDHISQYSFREYIRERPKFDYAISNWQTYNIAGVLDFEKAKTNLERFSMVGLVEEFDKSLILLQKIMHQIGFPTFKIVYKPANVSQNKNISMNTLPKDLLRELVELNQEDLQLYNYTKIRLNEEAIKVQDFMLKTKIFKINNTVHKTLLTSKMATKELFQKVKSV